MQYGIQYGYDCHIHVTSMYIYIVPTVGVVLYGTGYNVYTQYVMRE